jgi:hypothetical protein
MLAPCRVLRHSLDHSTISPGTNRGKLHSTGISFPKEKCFKLRYRSDQLRHVFESFSCSLSSNLILSDNFTLASYCFPQDRLICSIVWDSVYVDWTKKEHEKLAKVSKDLLHQLRICDQTIGSTAVLKRAALYVPKPVSRTCCKHLSSVSSPFSPGYCHPSLP